MRIAVTALLAALALPWPAGAQSGFSIAASAARKTAPYLPATKTLVKEASCDVARDFARRIYLSNAVRPEEYRADPAQPSDQAVVYQGSNDDDPYARDDYAHVQKQDLDKELRHFAWIKGENDNGYYAVYQEAGSWRGDPFTIYATQDLEKAKALAKTYAEYRPKPKADLKADPENVEIMHFISQAFPNEPLFLYDGKTKQISFVAFASGWNVFQMDDYGMPQRACAITFPDAKLRFPSTSLKRIAALLDAIIGIPKESEGTLHPVATLHAKAGRYWRNALYRPWALSTPANTRATVDKKLLAWSKIHWTYGEQYRQLKRLYPLAEKDLAAYYAKAFHMKTGQAQVLAKTVLDSVFRNHFRYSGKS